MSGRRTQKKSVHQLNNQKSVKGTAPSNLILKMTVVIKYFLKDSLEEYVPVVSI